MIETYAETFSGWVSPNGNPLAFSYRQGTNDWNTINACVGTNDEYGLAGLRLSGHVVDIGGYLGSVGVTVAVDNPDVRVTIVEPVPWNADLIRRNAQRNGVADRVTVIEGAAGKGGESISVWFGYRGNELAEHHAFVGNSTLAYDDAGPLDHDEATYTAISLAELAGTDEIALLKIDCEGGEWSILASPAVKRCRLIVGEAHAVRGHKGKDIVKLLSKTHDVELSGDPEATCGFRAVLR